jgi:hypothetical protein
LNNKIILIKRTSAVFLAIVLVAGTFALASPSFMVGVAQATSDRDKDYHNVLIKLSRNANSLLCISNYIYYDYTF